MIRIKDNEGSFADKIANGFIISGDGAMVSTKRIVARSGKSQLHFNVFYSEFR